MPTAKTYSKGYHTRLLAGTALSAGLVLMLTRPGAAQLTVNNGVVSNTGITATDGTTNTNRNAGANSSFLQMFNTAGPTAGMNMGTISGNGLALDATATTLLGDTVSMVNTGIIQPANNVISALSLVTDGGSVTYSGNGSVLNNVANGDGLVANGSALALLNTVGGGVTITAGGAISGNQGIVASTNFGGNVTVTTSNNITSADGGNGPFTPQFAINSLTENGTSTVRVNSGIVTGGISSQASVNGGSVVQIDGGTIQSIANSAINAHTLNGLNQVTINGGTLSGAAGQAVVNAFTDFTGTGGVNVAMHGGTLDGTVNGSSFGIFATTGVAPVGTTFDSTATGNVVVQTDAGSNIIMNSGTGVSAGVYGTAGSVTATIGGKIGTPNIGSDAFIDNPMNSNNVVVHVDNSIDAVQIGGRARIQAGTGNVFVDGAGAIGAVTAPNQFGLVANNNGGTGGVTVAGAGPVTSTGTAIAATITAGGAGNVVVQRGGAINGGTAFLYNPSSFFGTADPTQGAGITATTNGSGTVTVQANGGVMATGGIGVLARGGAPFLAGQNAVSVDTTGGLVTAMGTGAVGNDAIVANATGTGSILVKSDAVTEKTGVNNAINAAATTGAVTVQTNGLVTGGAAARGILATNTTGNGVNPITVTTKGLVIGGDGIDAGNIVTASPVTVTAQAGVTGGAGFGIRARGTSGNVTVDSTGGLVQATGGDAVIASSTAGAILVKTDAVTENTGVNNAINAAATTGAITVQTNGLVTGGAAARGILATNTTGNGANPISVTTKGLVIGGDGIDAGNAGTASPVTVTAQADVTGSAGFGIRARGTTGNVTVDSTGGLVQATDDDAVIASSTTGAILVKTDAVTEKTGVNNAINAAATTGAITVQTNGLVTGGAVARGILATNTTGNGVNPITVTTKGLVIGGDGIDAGNTGTASPVTVTAQAGVTGGAGFGIRARGTTGNVTVDSTGGLVQATGGDAVIASSTTGTIQVSTGPVTAIGGNGIVGTSTTGGISVISNGSVTSDIGTGIIGLQMGAAAGGNVQVLSQNTVSGAVGINAAAISTDNLIVTVGNNVTGTAGNGIVSNVAAGTANVNVNNVDTTITGTGAATSGIDSTTGVGGITNINIVAGALVTDTIGRGITTNAVGSGVTRMTNSGTIVGAGTTANPVISIANAIGTVTIDNNALGLIGNNKAATAAANNALAIATMTPAAIGAYNINNSGTLIGAIALGGGANTFTNLGGGQWVGSDGATFSAAAFGGGATNFLNNNLNGTIFTGTPAAGSVANFVGLQTIINAGNFYAGNSTASLTNLNPNPATAQTVTNSGAFNVSGALNFANLGTHDPGSTFTNGTPSATGMIDMSQFAAATAADGTVFPANTHAVTDRVMLGTIAAVGISDQSYQYTFGSPYNYVGTPGQSVLNLDANLGPAGSASDRLIVSGTAMGKTAINLWDTSTVPNAFNPTGITLAAVNGASANAFFLNGQINPAHQTPGSPLFDLYEPNVGPMGAIKKGFFFDPLLQDTAGFLAQGGSAASSRYALFGLPDEEAFQLPIAITAAQNIWDQTTLGWLDRQDELRNWMSQLTTANATGAGADSSVNSKPGAIETRGPGVWLKGIGSWTNRDVSRGLGDILPAAGVLGNFNLDYNQDTYAIIGGVDSGKVTVFIPGDIGVVGVMGGYIHSNVNFNRSPTSFKFTGGTVGASFLYLNSGWFADGLVKADLLNLNLNFPTLGEFGVAATTVSGTNLGGLADFGYRWDGSAVPWGAGYIEPIGTLSYVRTHFDNFSVPGLTANLGPGRAFRGAVGARAGSMWLSTPEYEVDSSITAKVWDQFSTQNGVTLQLSDLTLNDRYSKAFGEVTGQINVMDNARGWSGFVRSGVKFNTQFSTVSAKAGVTYRW